MSTLRAESDTTAPVAPTPTPAPAPVASVCEDQNKFNEAVHKAMKYAKKMRQEEEDKEEKNGYMYVYVVLYMIFFIWAVMLALKVESADRPLHIALAILMSPIYVLSYYLSGLESGRRRSGSMGMCGMKHY